MRRIIILTLIGVLLSGLLSACGQSLKATDSTIALQKKGKIIEAVRENLDKEYYNAEELEAYVKQKVEEYTAKHGTKSVVLNSFSVKDGKAVLDLTYAGYEDYAAFNQTEFFAGTVADAKVKGYDLAGEFVDSANKQVPADAKEAWDVLKVLILNEAIDVKVPGTIQYFTANDVSLINKSTAKVQIPANLPEGTVLPTVYIIYK